MKILEIKSIKNLWSYYGANASDYSYLAKCMDRIDQDIYVNKQNSIELNRIEIGLLYNMCNQILGESEIWDEYSIITGEKLDSLRKFRDYLYEMKILPSITLTKLSNIIQWSGLKTVEEITKTIFPILENNQEWIEYKPLFENLVDSVNDDELKYTTIPDELVSNILDTLGMVVFYRANSNTLSSLSYEQEGSELRLSHEWSQYIRDNGYKNVIEYNYEDETIVRTSDALLKYGYETIERVYERTNASLD